MNELTLEFQSFSKIPRLSRDMVITEKLDGTNAQILIIPAETIEEIDYKQATVVNDSVVIFAGSRNRWIQPGNDNYGFAAWVRDNAQELLKLGPGRHFGEWWGSGIQRGYGLKEKRFSLFNVGRWGYDAEARSINEWGTWLTRPGVIDQKTGVKVDCCHVVPVLARHTFSEGIINDVLLALKRTGSVAVPGFMDPEGIVIYHSAGGHLYKKTIKDDESPKTQPK